MIDHHNKPFIIPIFIPHAGCPHRCIFCDQHHTTGTAASLPSTETIEKCIADFLEYRKPGYRWTEISYFGGNFLGLPPHEIHRLLRIATTHVHNGTVNGIRFSTRPDTIDPDRLAAIMDFPVTTIEIGVQSMDDGVLLLNGRGHTARSSEKAVSLIRRRTASRLGVQMMIGMAGDTSATAMHSAIQIGDLSPDFIRIYPMLVLKGSVLEKWYHQGRYHPLALTEAVTQAKALLQHFSSLNIPVIRMGLQPTEDLKAGAGVVAGPFHPAFGELVYAAVWREALERNLAGIDGLSDPVIIKVNPLRLSQAKGQHNANTDYLNQRFQPLKIMISADKTVPMDVADINNRPYPLCIKQKE